MDTYRRAALSVVTLVLISLAWAWNKPTLAWIALAISAIDIPASAWGKGLEVLQEILDILAVVGPPLLFLPIFLLYRALTGMVGAGGTNAEIELAARFLPSIKVALACNIALNAVSLLWMIAFIMPFRSQHRVVNEGRVATPSEPIVIPQDEIDRREATKKVLAELRAESWKS